MRFLGHQRLDNDVAGKYTNNTGTYLGMSSIATPSSTFKTTTTPVFGKTNLTLPKTKWDGSPVKHTC